MSKKAGDKKKERAAAKLPELIIDPDSPERKKEESRKKREAYEMVQRAMIRSQIDNMLSTRENLMKQKAEIEAKMEEQSRDQSDIYQYLRDKLKNNFVSIADLEAQVSETHEDRLKRERELIATTKKLDEGRESEKSQLLERLEAVEAELQSIREFQENSATYEQKVKDLEARIVACKEAFGEEVTLLNAKSQKEWENGHKEKEERMKVIMKIAAEATQEQLDPKTKHMIAQNKKMMEELRFQCLEVEKMQRTHKGLLKSSALLLAKAASATHRVEELARRSHLLQKIIRHMHQKLKKCRSISGNPCMWRRRSTRGTSVDGQSPSKEAGADERGTELSEKVIATRYKLAGMSKEERQQLLDLRDELRREEVAIASAQALVEKKRKALAERSRVSALKADLARILISCLEDPLLGGVSVSEGIGDGASVTSVNDFISLYPSIKQPQSSKTRDASPTASSPFHDKYDAATPRAKSCHIPSFPRHDRHVKDGARKEEQRDQQERVTPQKTAPLLLPAIAGARQDGQPAAGRGVKYDASRDADGNKACEQGSWQRAAGMSADLPLWPESVPLPTTRTDGVVGLGKEQRSGGGRGKIEARHLDVEMLKAVLRLFLAKLQESVESIYSRTLGPLETSGLPALAELPTADDVHSRVPQKAPLIHRRRRRVGAHGCGGYDSPVRTAGGIVDGASSDNGLRDRVSRGAAAEDPVTSSSDRVNTGIPSWDMLEAAVRQTKRRSTRESACQTLTYRELRDHTAALSKTSMGLKSINLESSSAQVQSHRHTHASLSRRSARANTPSYPVSLATTVSDVSVYQSTQDDDTVHDAAFQGRGGVRGVDWWGTARPLGCRSPSGLKMDENARFGGESRGSNGSGAGQRSEGGDGGGDAQDEAGAAHTRAVVERLRQFYDADSVGNENTAFSLGTTPCPIPLPCQSETTDSRGTNAPSHRVGRVCVSWEDEKGEEEPGAELEAATAFKGTIAKGGKFSGGDSWGIQPSEQESQGVGRAHSEAEQRREEEEVDDSFCKCDIKGGDPDGNSCSYSPLPKGLDYRKVILYTVEDGDRRSMRRKPGKLSGPAAVSAAAGATFEGSVSISRSSSVAGGLAVDGSGGGGKHLRTDIDPPVGWIHDPISNEAVHVASASMTPTSASTVLVGPLQP